MFRSPTPKPVAETNHWRCSGAWYSVPCSRQQSSLSFCTFVSFIPVHSGRWGFHFFIKFFPIANTHEFFETSVAVYVWNFKLTEIRNELDFSGILSLPFSALLILPCINKIRRAPLRENVFDQNFILNYCKQDEVSRVRATTSPLLSYSGCLNQYSK